MQRLLTTSILAIAFAAVAMPAEAQTLWSEDWEQPTWNVGDVIITQNGWERASGNFSRPEITAGYAGLTGQVADAASNVGGTIGTFSSFTNDAGLAGGPPVLPAGTELALAFRWVVNPTVGEGATGSANVGFLSGVNLGISIVNGGADIRFTDMNDNDHVHALPGGTAEQVLDLELFATPTYHGWRLGGVAQQTINSAATWNNINSIRWGCGRDAGVDCGIMGDMRVYITPEPASLGLLALGGLALVSRRRRA